MIKIKHALISSWRKPPAVKLARLLSENGVKLTASGGTADAIASSGLTVNRLSSVTGFNNLLGGRVKTLHPAVYAAILAKRDNTDDLADLKQLQLNPVDLVAVDLYPFPASENNFTIEDAVELIDIGGVSLIRAAAKNHKHVLVLHSADQFEPAVKIIEAGDGSITDAFALDSAVKAFRHTSMYDAGIELAFKRFAASKNSTSDFKEG